MNHAILVSFFLYFSFFFPTIQTLFTIIRIFLSFTHHDLYITIFILLYYFFHLLYYNCYVYAVDELNVLFLFSRMVYERCKKKLKRYSKFVTINDFFFIIIIRFLKKLKLLHGNVMDWSAHTTSCVIYIFCVFTDILQ